MNTTTQIQATAEGTSALDNGSGGTGHLKRVLGLRSLLSVAIGLVVTQGVMVLALQGLGIAGIGFFIAMAIAFILALFAAFSFAELSLMMPRAGTLSTYTQVAIGQFPAIVATFSGYVVVAMFAVAAELQLIGLILSEIFPNFLSPMALGLLILGIFAVLNIVGVDIFAKLQTVLAFTMVVSISVLGAAAILGTNEPQLTNLDLFSDWNPIGTEVFSLIALAIWLFVGAEFVCPLVEETKNPEKNIPKSMFYGLFTILGVYLLFCIGAFFYLPLDQMASSSLPHLDYAVAVFGDSGLEILAIVAITATCSTVNTTLASVPRMLYGMAQNKQAFPIFKRLDKRFNTPAFAILFMAVIIGAPMVVLGDKPDTVLILLLAASACWLLAYIISHIDVIVLRNRIPDANRPFKTPFYPLPQILGIIGMGYAAYNVSPSPEMTQQIFVTAGAVLGLVSIIAALWVKFYMKKNLFEPESIEDALKD
ncbi:APC family permease [Colwellia demingiae]|uniref:APC family permease n=1 Tax=Colwellia demingiae TaxID=89401 RepID=A0A5C6Q418_9GAMM|nr:APC family permease [Colwellia demingiae]TWX63558.1 APC family permease [Colwellia demingiae]